MWDFGFFCSIQSLQNQTTVTKLNYLVSVVEDVFQERSSITLDKVWLSLARSFEEANKCKEGNESGMPHDDKEENSSQLYECFQTFECETDFHNHASPSLYSSSLPRASQ